jgi:hypothetical protein
LSKSGSGIAADHAKLLIDRMDQASLINNNFLRGNPAWRAERVWRPPV